MSRQPIPNYVHRRQSDLPPAARMNLPAMRLREEIAVAINWELGSADQFTGKQIDCRRMARVMAFVGQHIEQNFTVADLADVACMSPAHFARSFKLTTGRCPHEFVSRIRLTLAKRMLADHQLPISDVALSAGFSSQSNFARAFRDATGMTPRDYRAAS